MDEVARLPAKDRADLFSTAATRRGDMLSALVEKDFWVCWSLKRVLHAGGFTRRLDLQGRDELVEGLSGHRPILGGCRSFF